VHEWSGLAESGRDGPVGLRCTRCGAPGLRATAAQAWIYGSRRGKSPLLDQLPRFVAEEHYTRPFCFQWNRFARTRLSLARGALRSGEEFLLKPGGCGAIWLYSAEVPRTVGGEVLQRLTPR